MKYCVTINGKRYEIEVEKGNASILSTTEVAFGVTEDKKVTDAQTAAAIQHKVIESSEQTAEINAVTGKAVVKAPMAGGITDIKVSIGSEVNTGDTLLMLEAMKMENEITAPVDGIVAEIRISKGTVVAADDILVVLK